MALFTLSGLKGSISNFFGVRDLSEFGKTIQSGDYIYHVFLGPVGPTDSSFKSYTLDLTGISAASFPMPVAFLYVGGGGHGGMPGWTPSSNPEPGAYDSFTGLNVGGGGGGGAGQILYSDSEFINSPGLYPIRVGGSNEPSIGISSVGAALTAYAGGVGGVGIPDFMGEYNYPPTHPNPDKGPYYPPSGTVDPNWTSFGFPTPGPPNFRTTSYRNLWGSRNHYPGGIPPSGWGHGAPGGSGGGAGANEQARPQPPTWGYRSNPDYYSSGGNRLVPGGRLPANTGAWGNPGGRARVEEPASYSNQYGGGGGGAGGAGEDAHLSITDDYFPERADAGHGGPGQPFPIFAAPIIAPAIPSTYRTSWSNIVGASGLYGGGGSGSQLNVSDPESPDTRAPGGGGYGGTYGDPQPDSTMNGFRWTGGGGAACPYANPRPDNEPGDGGSGIIIIRRPA